MSLRDQLRTIYETQGELTPALVVEVARPKDHPLHARFEWNDKVAGEAYRRAQAQDLIRSVKVIHADPESTVGDVREFLSVERSDGHTYVPIDEIQGDEVTTAIVMRQAEREWKQLKRRYENLRGWLAVVRQDVAS